MKYKVCNGRIRLCLHYVYFLCAFFFKCRILILENIFCNESHYKHLLNNINLMKECILLLFKKNFKTVLSLYPKSLPLVETKYFFVLTTEIII